MRYFPIKKFFKAIAGLCAGVTVLFMTACSSSTAAPRLSPEQEMVRLTTNLRSYATERNPHFQLVGNGAAGLLEVTKHEPESSVQELVNTLDGFLTESFFYTNDDDTIGLQAPDMLDYLEAMMEKPMTAGKAVWTLDYLPDGDDAAMDRAKGRARGYVSNTSETTALKDIPDGNAQDENANDITTVKDARNFLILLNPENFSSREDYLASLAATPYDALVIDLYYDDEPLTAEEVARLQQKPQGGRRLVLAYLSVGEAADYRSYWQDAWEGNASRPSWIAKANPDWPGSYRVRYWTDEWRHILYGSETSYLDQILAAGFDGAFLDVMDAWQSFT